MAFYWNHKSSKTPRSLYYDHICSILNRKSNSHEQQYKCTHIKRSWNKQTTNRFWWWLSLMQKSPCFKNQQHKFLKDFSKLQISTFRKKFTSVNPGVSWKMDTFKKYIYIERFGYLTFESYITKQFNINSFPTTYIPYKCSYFL